MKKWRRPDHTCFAVCSFSFMYVAVALLSSELRRKKKNSVQQIWWLLTLDSEEYNKFLLSPLCPLQRMKKRAMSDCYPCSNQLPRHIAVRTLFLLCGRFKIPRVMNLFIYTGLIDFISNVVITLCISNSYKCCSF